MENGERKITRMVRVGEKKKKNYNNNNNNKRRKLQTPSVATIKILS
jgi:hypothetical protein